MLSVECTYKVLSYSMECQVFKIEATKGEIKPKSRLASCRFSQKNRTDEFDLFVVKSKKANKTNSVFGEKLADH